MTGLFPDPFSSWGEFMIRTRNNMIYLGCHLWEARDVVIKSHGYENWDEFRRSAPEGFLPKRHGPNDN